MKKYILSLFVLLITASLAHAGGDNWKLAAEIERAIVKTSFPADTFNIIDFGAVADDHSFLNTKAIEAAILRCHEFRRRGCTGAFRRLDYRPCDIAKQR